MVDVIINMLLLLAACLCFNGIMGICRKIKNESFAEVGLFCLLTGVVFVLFGVVFAEQNGNKYSLLATLFISASFCNTLSAQIQRICILYGFEPARLYKFAEEWRLVRVDGDYHKLLSTMKNSEYFRYISDALRIVHSIAVSLPRDHTFRVTDYGYLVDAFSLKDHSKYTILVAYPTIKQEDLKDLTLIVDSKNAEDIYVVSDNFGIRITELLDDMSDRLLSEKYNNVTIKYN